MARTQMSKRAVRRTRYSPEFKAEAVAMIRRGRRVAELAAELGVGEQSLYRWLEVAKVDEVADPAGPLTSAERAELVALRRRLHDVEQERDFLKKTAAYFASARK